MLAAPQDNEAGTQVGWVLVAPGDTPRGARPGALLLRRAWPPPGAPAGSVLSPGSCALLLGPGFKLMGGGGRGGWFAKTEIPPLAECFLAVPGLLS